jgi:gas vesicle protein
MEDSTMNDSPDIRGSSSIGSTLMGFALGAAVGAGLALLLAPDSGTKTRERLTSTARRWRNRAEHTIDQARDTVVELGTDAKAALKAGQDAFVHDRAKHESPAQRLMSHAGDAAPGHNAAARPTEGVAR